MNKKNRINIFAFSILIGSLLLAACAPSTSDQNETLGTIAVGSKDFTEQFIVAEMYAQILEDAGFSVERKLNLGGTPIAHEAILNGDIDLYPEYTSTGLLTVLKLNPIQDAQEIYGVLEEDVDGVSQMLHDEEKHEDELIGMIDETKLDYIGSIVLGLNDALVELTGTLAGLSFAFQDTNLIALSGLITGIAASMSMGASEYLSTRAEEGENAIRAALYTGISYIFTVVFLVLPFFVFESYIVSLPVTLIIAVVIILLFNYYVSVAMDMNFRKQFTEMASISLGVSGLSFLVGVLVKTFLGVDV